MLIKSGGSFSPNLGLFVLLCQKFSSKRTAHLKPTNYCPNIYHSFTKRNPTHYPAMYKRVDQFKSKYESIDFKILGEMFKSSPMPEKIT